MTKTKRMLSELTLAFLVVALALSIIFQNITGISYFIVGPSCVLLIMGGWSICLGFITIRSKYRPFTFGPRNATYFLGWGFVLSVTGFLFIVHWAFPQADLALLFAFFLLLIGVIVISAIVYARGREK